MRLGVLGGMCVVSRILKKVSCSQSLFQFCRMQWQKSRMVGLHYQVHSTSGMCGHILHKAIYYKHEIVLVVKVMNELY